MIRAYIANASLCNIPFLFLCFLCHPYIFTIFVENLSSVTDHIILILIQSLTLKILHKSYLEFGSFSAVSCTKCTNMYPFNIKLYTLVQETVANFE